MATKKSAKKAAKRGGAKRPAKKAAKRAPARKTARKGGARKSTAKKAAKKTTAKKGAAKKTAKKAPARKAAKKSTAKRRPNPAFMKPMTPSPELGAVVGTQPMPRTEVTKKVWAYIKRKGLQDPREKRMINADENLKKVFGGKNKVSMFEMTALVNKHLK